MPTPEFATPSQIRALFDRIAPHYDDLNQSLSLGLHQIWKTMTVLWADPPVGGEVVDLCCGSGDLALILARYVGRQGRVTGVDFSPALLAMARQRGERFFPGFPFVWLEADVLDLPLPSARYAAVTVGYGLRNVVHIPRCLQEIHRILRPGGKVAILDFHQPRDPQLAAWQRWYLHNRVVPEARRRGIGAEYRYIAPSLAGFPDGETQKKLALEAGLADPHFYPLLGGMMGVLVASKPL